MKFGALVQAFLSRNPTASRDLGKAGIGVQQAARAAQGGEGGGFEDARHFFFWEVKGTSGTEIEEGYCSN